MQSKACPVYVYKLHSTCNTCEKSAHKDNRLWIEKVHDTKRIQQCFQMNCPDAIYCLLSGTKTQETGSKDLLRADSVGKEAFENSDETGEQYSINQSNATEVSSALKVVK